MSFIDPKGIMKQFNDIITINLVKGDFLYKRGKKMKNQQKRFSYILMENYKKQIYKTPKFF